MSLILSSLPESNLLGSVKLSYLILSRANYGIDQHIDLWVFHSCTFYCILT